MPPKRAAEGGSAPRGRPKGSQSNPPTAAEPASSNPFDSSDDEGVTEVADVRQEEAAPAAETEKTIPRELLTRLLHQFFAKDVTRISRDANAAVGKYVDVFVKEAIARTAVEKRGGFLEVDDLEKVTPQLLLDL